MGMIRSDVVSMICPVELHTTKQQSVKYINIIIKPTIMHFSYRNHLQQPEWVQALPWEMACIQAKLRVNEPAFFVYGKDNIRVDIHSSHGKCGSVWKFMIDKVLMMCNHGGFVEHCLYTPEYILHIVNLKSGTHRAVSSNGLIQRNRRNYNT